jgi:hypothetical protein
METARFVESCKRLQAFLRIAFILGIVVYLTREPRDKYLCLVYSVYTGECIYFFLFNPVKIEISLYSSVSNC